MRGFMLNINGVVVVYEKKEIRFVFIGGGVKV